MKKNTFLTSKQQTKVVDAIGRAESVTSGEIRVHIEHYCKNTTPYDRAVTIFNDLKMYETEARNGVLIYLASDSKVFAIIGDKGINEKVGKEFWNEEKQLLISYLKEGKIAEGLCAVIDIIGQNLSKYFPYQADDKNELSNDISYGE